LLWAGGADSDYKPRKRQLDIALFLRGRVEAYVSGTLSAEDFRAACRKEAANIAVEKVSDDATNIQQIRQVAQLEVQDPASHETCNLPSYETHEMQLGGAPLDPQLSHYDAPYSWLPSRTPRPTF
jgi:hypothetical protein